MENYHLVPTVDDKKHFVGVFDQKIKNYGLWSILIQGCRNLKIMDFFGEIIEYGKLPSSAYG